MKVLKNVLFLLDSITEEMRETTHVVCGICHDPIEESRAWISRIHPTRYVCGICKPIPINTEDTCAAFFATVKIGE